MKTYALFVYVDLDVGEVREALGLSEEDTAGMQTGSIRLGSDVPWADILEDVGECEAEDMVRAINATGNAGEALCLMLKAEGFDFLRLALSRMNGLERRATLDDLETLCAEQRAV